MYRPIVPSVLASYELDYVSIGRVQKGYRNESYPVGLRDGTTVNLLFYKREPGMLDRIKRIDDITNYLSREGLPVRVRRDSRTSVLRAADNVSYAVLYTYLPGKTISWEAYTKKHIKLLGAAMSDMHAILRGSAFSWSETTDITTDLQALLGRMDAYFGRAEVQRAIQDKLGIEIDMLSIPTLRRLVSRFDDTADRQPLHMDMVRGNVLFSTAHEDDRWQIGDVALTGVIDFEKTAIGHPLFDIARTLAFLLVDCVNKDETKVIRYFLLSGYSKRGRAVYDRHATINGASHAQLLDGLIALFLLHDFYKFLRHTPYESLQDNEHYIRTRNILIRHGMVRYL